MQPERQIPSMKTDGKTPLPFLLLYFFTENRSGTERVGDRDKRVYGRTNTNGNTTGTGREPETYTGMTHYKTYLYCDTLHIQ